MGIRERTRIPFIRNFEIESLNNLLRSIPNIKAEIIRIIRKTAIIIWESLLCISYHLIFHSMNPIGGKDMRHTSLMKDDYPVAYSF